MRTNTYTVEGIHCRSCEQTIRTLVGDVAGVLQVEPDHRTNQIAVTYDETLVDDVAVREALTNAGFWPR